MHLIYGPGSEAATRALERPAAAGIEPRRVLAGQSERALRVRHAALIARALDAA